jgi:hypothetical protein
MDSSGSTLPGAISAHTALRLAALQARLRVGFPFWLRPFLMPGVLAITLGRRIYLAPAMLSRKPQEIESLIRHELVHVRQVVRLGLVRFFLIYVRDYLRLRRRGMTRHQAYANIPFELEAEREDQEGRGGRRL